MNPWGLAWRRYRTLIQYQWKTAGTVLDWTVVLYFVVPALLLGGKFYYDWWNKPLSVPEFIVAWDVWYLLFLLPLFMARLHTWQEGADMLFLRHLPDWRHTLIRFGIMEMLVHQAVLLMVIKIIGLPWLIRAIGIPIEAIYRTVLLSWLLSCLYALIQNQIEVRYIGWKRMLLSILPLIFVILAYGWGVKPLSTGWTGTIVAAIVMICLLIPLC